MKIRISNKRRDFKVKGQGRKVTWCVWQVLADKSRKKRPRKIKIGRKIVHSTSNNAQQFQGQRSKVKIKVTRPINAHTVNAQYLPNRMAYELQTLYTDGSRWPASATSVVTFKVKGQGRKVTWCIWQVMADNSRTKRSRNTKIGEKVVHLTGNNAHQFEGQRSRSSGRLMPRSEVRHIFWTGKSTKFSLGTQTEDEDPRHRRASWPPRSQVKVARSRDASERFARYVKNETS